MMAAEKLLAVTVLGQDRPGIVADTTAALAGLSGNLEDSTMTLLRGHFAMVVLVRVSASIAEVRESLSELAVDGRLSVDVRAVPGKPPWGHASAGVTYLLRVYGADRPGIVTALTRIIADAGGSITDLTTRLRDDLYVLLAELILPEQVNPAEIADALHVRADALGIEVTMGPLDLDEL
ncbi:MAG: glycine cleavage system protein R [Actinomycetota bacterium]